MKQISAQSKSFIILSSIAFLGTLMITAYGYFAPLKSPMNLVQVVSYPKPTPTNSSSAQTQAQNEKVIPVDTSSWKEYVDSAHGISFKYNPDWKVRTGRTRSGWYVLQLDPGAKYDNINIFVSDKDYFAMGGLPVQEQQMSGTTVLSVMDMLYGMKNNHYYYTFDLGASVSLQPQFVALVNSVKLASQ